MEDDQLLAQESVLDNEFSFAASEVNGGIRERSVAVWLDPASKRLQEGHTEQVENAANEENHGLPL